MRDVTKPGGEAVVVTLKAEPDGALKLRSIELLALRARIRVSFPADATPDEALSGGAAEEMHDLARTALDTRGTVAMPDFVLSIDGLRLIDCCLLTTGTADGGEQIIVRFNRMEGSFSELFAEGATARRALESGARSELEAAALEAFERAYLPLMDFAAHVDALAERGQLAAGADAAASALLTIRGRIGGLGQSRAALAALAARRRGGFEAGEAVPARPLIA